MTAKTTSSYAFILPRFFEGIAGGAETLVGNLAQKLHARGDIIEVWTTCAKDNRTWENHFEAGLSQAFGVPVRRFRVDDRNLDLWIPRQISISEGMEPGLEDQFIWLEHSVNSRELYAHIAGEADKFEALFFAPYLFGTTFWGSLIRPEKSYLIPCLHNEHYAYVPAIQSMFRQVAGAVFNSEPELELAQQLFPGIRGGVVGMGFEPYAPDYVSTLEPYFKESFPYVLYLGRKETGKNAQVMLDHFCALKDSGQVNADLRLVIAGGGSFSDLHRPGALRREDIVDLDHVSEEDKRRLLKHALVLCQPSVNESFSIVLMEAWLLGTPVLVHAGCPVTKQHVVDSGGGLYFSGQEDFGAVISRLTSDSALCSQLGKAGREYVSSEYSWAAVLQRFNQTMSILLDPEGPATQNDSEVKP